jgi:tryptophan-rich sensory protein
MSRRTALWEPVATAACAAIAVAAVGGTLTELGPWYHSLKEPSWKPPDAAFGVIWTAIYAFAAAAGVIGWRADHSVPGRQWMLGLFAANGFFNVLWSLVFFKLHRPDFALVEVAALWLSILVLGIFLYRRSALAGLLMAPYLLWVSIAAALNYQVVVLNGPFS